MMKNSIGFGIGVATVALVAVTIYRKQIGQAAVATAQAVNPVNPNNIFAGGANDALSAVTGKNTTIGGSVFDAGHDTNGNPNLLGRLTDWLIL